MAQMVICRVGLHDILLEVNRTINRCMLEGGSRLITFHENIFPLGNRFLFDVDNGLQETTKSSLLKNSLPLTVAWQGEVTFSQLGGEASELTYR